MEKKEKFKIGDTVKVRQTSSIGEITGIYKIGRKEILILKIKNGQKIKVPSDSCTNY